MQKNKKNKNHVCLWSSILIIMFIVSLLFMACGKRHYKPVSEGDISINELQQEGNNFRMTISGDEVLLYIPEDTFEKGLGSQSEPNSETPSPSDSNTDQADEADEADETAEEEEAEEEEEEETDEESSSN